jgi:hypothetical protein
MNLYHAYFGENHVDPDGRAIFTTSAILGYLAYTAITSAFDTAVEEGIDYALTGEGPSAGGVAKNYGKNFLINGLTFGAMGKVKHLKNAGKATKALAGYGVDVAAGTIGDATIGGEGWGDAFLGNAVGSGLGRGVGKGLETFGGRIRPSGERLANYWKSGLSTENQLGMIYAARMKNVDIVARSRAVGASFFDQGVFGMLRKESKAPWHKGMLTREKLSLGRRPLIGGGSVVSDLDLGMIRRQGVHIPQRDLMMDDIMGVINSTTKARVVLHGPNYDGALKQISDALNAQSGQVFEFTSDGFTRSGSYRNLIPWISPR